METTLKIEGMSCGHCVRSVSAALKGVPGVEEAQVDLATAIATVRHTPEASAAQLKAAVEEEGYGAEEA